MNRIVLAAVAAGLLAAPVPAAVAAKPKPKPKPLPLCVAYADPSGDTAVRGVVPASESALDITKVRFATANSSFLSEITVAKFAERPTLAAGNRFQVTFTVAGKVVDVYYKIGPAREQEANAFYQQGVRVDGTFVHDAVTGTVKGNTVTLAVKLNMLKSAVGKAVEGQRATEVKALAMASLVGTNETFDTAVAPASGFVVGQVCR